MKAEIPVRSLVLFQVRDDGSLDCGEKWQDSGFVEWIKCEMREKEWSQ